MHAWLKSAAITGCLLGTALLAAGTAVADDAPAKEPGVWQKHQYSFAFLGFTSTYSCDGLADKLKVLLLAAGARPDVKARAGACASGFGHPDKFARADLTFYTLSPSNGAAPGTGSTADASATTKPVDGTWRTVSLSDHSPRELSTGDCELTEQFRNTVLPMFTTRNIDSHTTCIPHQNSGSVIDLKFDAFAPAAAAPRMAAGGAQ